MRVPDDYEFDASSAVGRYWLIHGVGFTVCRGDGRKLGVVEDIVVDPYRQHAEHVIVRRRGLYLRRRRATIDAGDVEAVAPASQRFRLESPPSDASPTSLAADLGRVGEVTVFARAAGRGLSRAAVPVGRATRRGVAASRPLASELLRGVVAGLVVVGRLSASGATAGAGAAATAAGRARREAPRLESWISGRARATGRSTLTVLRWIGRFTRAAAARLGAAAAIAARALGDLAVLAAVLATAGWRRAAARSTPRTTGPDEGALEDQDPHASQRRSDADAPLGRETSGEAPTNAGARKRRAASARRSTADAGSDRRSDRS